MDYSFAKACSLVALMILLSTKTHSQTALPYSDTVTSLGQFPLNEKKATRIKWTWQLPVPVKKAFNESHYKNWFIEKMTKYDSCGKIFYRFRLNNGNLLDGDHYDSFLENACLDISDTGVIVRKQFP